MEGISVRDNKLMPVFLACALLFTSIFYSNYVHANNASSPPGTQLAYFVGYHSYYGAYYPGYGEYYPGYVYYRTRNYHRAYWTHWIRIGYACRQKCLINRWNGRVVRCVRRCYD